MPDLDALVVSLRADTRAFKQGVAEVTDSLNTLDQLGQGSASALTAVAESATANTDLLRTATASTLAGLEGAFARFARTGKLAFSDLRSIALSVLSDIAQAMTGIGGGSGPFGGAAAAILSTVFGGLSARATGGPVSPGTPYLVGEAGPELFLPSVGGRITPNHGLGGTAGPSRPINITVNVTGADDPEGMRRSATQVAMAVRRALARAEGAA